MTPRPDHRAVERTFRDLLADNGLPAPDEVAHWRDAVLFGWHDSRAVVVVDLDEVEDLEGLDPGALLGLQAGAPLH